MYDGVCVCVVVLVYADDILGFLFCGKMKMLSVHRHVVGEPTTMFINKTGSLGFLCSICENVISMQEGHYV